MREMPKQKARSNKSPTTNERIFKAYKPPGSSNRKEDRQKQAAQALQSQLTTKKRTNVSQDLGCGKRGESAGDQSNYHSEMADAYLRHYQSGNYKKDIIPPIRKNHTLVVPKVINDTFKNSGIQELRRVHNCYRSDELATVLCALAFCRKYGQLSKRDEDAKLDELAKNDELADMDGFTHLDDFVHGYVTYLWIHRKICISAPGHLLPRYPRFFDIYHGKFIKDLSTNIITVDVLIELRSSYPESWDSVFQNRKEDVDLKRIVSDEDDSPGSIRTDKSSPGTLSSPFTSIATSPDTPECVLKDLKLSRTQFVVERIEARGGLLGSELAGDQNTHELQDGRWTFCSEV